jgi:hypothetical protein
MKKILLLCAIAITLLTEKAEAAYFESYNTESFYEGGISSFIGNVSYDRRYKLLAVEIDKGAFSNKYVYIYYDVPQYEFNRFKNSFSKGSYFNDHIRDEYNYTRLK